MSYKPPEFTEENVVRLYKKWGRVMNVARIFKKKEKVISEILRKRGVLKGVGDNLRHR